MPLRTHIYRGARAHTHTHRERERERERKVADVGVDAKVFAVCDQEGVPDKVCVCVCVCVNVGNMCRSRCA